MDTGYISNFKSETYSWKVPWIQKISGWCLVDASLIPVMMEEETAPDGLLNII